LGVVDLTAALLRGLAVTVEVTLLASLVALTLAFAVGLARLSQAAPARVLAAIYVETLRGVSALVQLFCLFFILPLFGVFISPMATAVIGLGMNFSAYGSEVVRAAVVSVDRSQWEAARALDMPRALTMRRIILPQALPMMLPPFGNLLIEMLKTTSLVSLITLTDLTFAGQRLIETYGRQGLVWGLVLGLYFLAAFPLSRLVRRLERRVAAGRAGGP